MKVVLNSEFPLVIVRCGFVQFASKSRRRLDFENMCAQGAVCRAILKRAALSGLTGAIPLWSGAESAFSELPKERSLPLESEMKDAMRAHLRQA